MKLSIRYNKVDQEATVRVQGVKLGMSIICNSAKEAKKIATESLAHREYLEYTVQKQSVSFQELKAMRVTLNQAVNSSIRLLVLKGMDSGMSIDGAISLANFVYDGNWTDAILTAPPSLIGFVKEIEGFLICGRVA